MNWHDKMDILGVVFVVAEALSRDDGAGDEFTDRVSWVSCMSLISQTPSGADPRALIMQYRRRLSELRASFMTFTIVSLHASILVVMRTLQFMTLVLEMIHEPFQWVVERHVQDLVFLCDFASVVLRSSPTQHSHTLHMPALYANETFVRMLPWLFGCGGSW